MAPRDNDILLDLPPVFGSGVIGVCDICGTRQAVIVLNKERFKLCVTDFLNKTWLKTDKKPGAPLPPYRSERVWYPTDTTSTGVAPGILLAPTKPAKRPGVLITPDVYGVTTTLIDGAIRLARAGMEVLVPDVAKTDGISPGHHLALRTGVSVRGGIPTSAKRVAAWVDLYDDALKFLRSRELVDPARTAVLGVSYGGGLAVALAARDTRLAAVALAYPMPVRPEGLPALITAPLLYLGGNRDRPAERSRQQLETGLAGASKSRPQFVVLPNVGHNFLARDLAAYDLQAAEVGWTQLVEFLKKQLFPPPPAPPVPPSKPAATPAASPAKPAPPSPTVPTPAA
jgi:carboxymethylenebutenolidase